ncbi:MAG: KamA family radical SAM protein [Gemmatimonadales bacterium]|nr:KamA family radical SAM protein [Gemmatimonadales bacterium]NIN11069.1 KamA family radical SAM protein [Gemmatimonadales bacterium]NIN49666.1 KamA family radical SAM protein [Gemmatimonadales bacterium]NIP07130.1 KamA family radical SAM protein [Gemmatimonadales bacterium]NIQ99521.1 KamA family radical SAM protein [Gemmatimonadales bacterium]
MAEWQKLLHDRGIRTLRQLVDKFGPEHFPDLPRLQAAVDNFEFRISPAMVDLIQEPGDPIWRQYMPDLQELEVIDGVVDSLNEDADSPVPNITHRYPDRVLFLVSPVCAAYCRFCTRRRKVGDPQKIPMAQLESAFRYLEQHVEIRDVILSGGDPLLLSDRRLSLILGRLRKIKHLEVIRIGSRIPCHLPERITPALCKVLAKHHPLYINTHFNHPAELTPAAVRALEMLADAGIPLGCQTVLLKGVNDDVEVMRELMQRLLTARVRPYYIFMCDNVAGVEHFKTNVEKGLEIILGLRGWISGLAVPHFVIDAPGGGGKIPLLPEYVESITESEVVLRNYRGERYVWTQPREEALVEAGAPESDYGSLPLFNNEVSLGRNNRSARSGNGNRKPTRRKRQ